jgi:hypothetical protein
VKSEDNNADIFTKNTTEELIHKHAKDTVEKENKANNTWAIGRVLKCEFIITVYCAVCYPILNIWDRMYHYTVAH